MATDKTQKLTYSEKLQDPRWQKKRLLILERDNWTCQYCGDKEKTLHVHHMEYVSRNPWDSPEEHLKALCKTCHHIVSLMEKICTWEPEFVTAILHSKFTDTTYYVILCDDVMVFEYTGDSLSKSNYISGMDVEHINAIVQGRRNNRV